MLDTMTAQYLRTMLVLIAPFALLASSVSLAIGLTFAPCYSSMCVEDYFPRETRYHIAFYYALLGLLAACLYIRSVLSPASRLSENHLIVRRIPWIGGRLSVGGLLLCIWVSLTFVSMAYWYPAQHRYWMARGALAHWTKYMHRVVWTGITGHWCDMWIGLVIFPVGRNSIIAKLFRIQTSTLLQVHKLLAVGLLVFSLIHGLLYYSFLAAWLNADNDKDVLRQFFPDNPALTEKQGKAKGIYAWFVLPTGAIAGLVGIPAMVITALPILRRNNYNVFYFLHVSVAVVVMVAVCLHASTNFYFLIPGLVLWIYDWVFRLTHHLTVTQDALIESADNDWYRIRLPADSKAHPSESTLEKGEDSHAYNPLTTYYLNFPAVSKLQLHPFTAVSPGDSTTGPTFLFRRSPPRATAKKSDKEWTWLLAALAAPDSLPISKITLKSHVEGPYSPQVMLSLSTTDHILLLAGGTGITGAISIATWWAHQPRTSSSSSSSISSNKVKSLHLIWTVREAQMAQLAEIQELQTLANEISGPQVQITIDIHVSGKTGRLPVGNAVEAWVRARPRVSPQESSRLWVYMSGPDTMVDEAESTCIRERRRLTREDNKGCSAGGNAQRLDWYAASYAL